LWQRIAEEVAVYPWSMLRIHARGEPMSHPEYVSMIGAAKRAGVGIVTSFTNGIYLHRHVEELLDSGIDMLEVSADAADPDRYQAWRRNRFFHKVVDGVRRLHAARERRPGCRTRIVVSAVDHPDFRRHRQDFERFWSPYCDRIQLRPFHTYGGLIRDPFQRVKTPDEYIPCVQLWERFSINTEGRVNACFNDWEDKDVVADLREKGMSIASVWRGEAFRAIRDASLSEPCVKCCFTCSGPSLSAWGRAGYQHWVRGLLGRPDLVEVGA
jgi:pyruvate-formate lyase-activating enzyme